MPLPRPFGDPLGRPNVKEDERSPKRKKEVAPISSSAFSFNLGAASTSTFTSTSTRTPKKIDVKSEHVDRRLQSTPIRYETPLREVSVSRSSMTPGAGPSKVGRPLQSLPSPFGGMSFKTPDTKVKLENGTRLGDMSLFGCAGLKSGNEDGKGKRKASDFDTKIQESRTGTGMDSPAHGMGRMRALGQLDKVDLGESMYLEDLHKRVEEEGIGVSPRGKKIIKYSGKGPPPLSFVLNNALSTQHSSLVLFYASLQSTLYPSRTPRKSRMTPSALTEGALKPTPLPKGPSVLHHLRTAPLVINVKGVVEGRTGWSVMVRGQVMSGQVEGKALGPDPTRSRLGDGDQTARNTLTKDKDDIEPVQDDQISDSTMMTTTSGTAKSLAEDDVVLVLQPIPPECPKLGLDARMITLKPPSSTMAYEIGIWPTWSDTSYDSITNNHDTEAYMDDEKSETARGKTKEKGEGEDSRVRQKVVFANRYLIAESDATTPTSL